MKTWLAAVLTLILFVSLGMNAFLWLSLKEHNDEAYELEAHYEQRLNDEKRLEGEVSPFDKKMFPTPLRI